MNDDYYVYVHRRATTGEPFYYGRGKNKRAWEPYRNTWHSNVTTKHGLVVEVLVNGLTKDESDELEIILIREARARKENIVNIRPGGEGFDSDSGRKASEGVRKDNARLKRGVCDPKVQAAACVLGGLATKSQGVGIFGLTFESEQRKLDNHKKTCNEPPFKRWASGRMKKNWEEDREAQLLAASTGGKKGGKTTSNLRRTCVECGLSSNPGAVARHQSVSGHIGIT